MNFIIIIIYHINLKGRRRNSGSNSRPIISSDFAANISLQLSFKPRSIIGPISIANIGCQHCERGPIILSYVGRCRRRPIHEISRRYITYLSHKHLNNKDNCRECQSNPKNTKSKCQLLQRDDLKLLPFFLFLLVL